MSSWGVFGQIRFSMKNLLKIEITLVKLRRFRQNQISTPNIIFEIDRRNKINTLGNFKNEIPANFKKLTIISKSISLGIRPKFGYHQNRYDSLNQFQKLSSSLIPGFNLHMYDS